MDSLTLRGGVMAHTSGLLTATGGVTSFDTTVTINFSIDGEMFQLTAQTTAATPTTDINTGVAFPALVGGASVANTPGHGCAVVWMVNKDGTVACAMGPHQILDMAGNFITAPQFPAIPAGYCPFAYQILKAGATASATAIIFGTGNWNVTGYTNAIKNVSTLPSRPRVS